MLILAPGTGMSSQNLNIGMSLDPNHEQKLEGQQGECWWAAHPHCHLPAASPSWHMAAAASECKSHTAAASFLPSASCTE